MKLYATLKSERASKSQGGNKFLEVNIQDEERNLVGIVRVSPNKEYAFWFDEKTYRKVALAKINSQTPVQVIGKTPYLCIGCCKKHVLRYASLCVECDKNIEQEECKHLMTTAKYEDKKLQGYECNRCGFLVKMNPAFQRGKKQKGKCCEVCEEPSGHHSDDACEPAKH